MRGPDELHRGGGFVTRQKQEAAVSMGCRGSELNRGGGAIHRGIPGQSLALLAGGRRVVKPAVFILRECLFGSQVFQDKLLELFGRGGEHGKVVHLR